MVGGFLYLVAAVPKHYLLGLCLVEPAATTVAQELQRLGEELMVVGHRLVSMGAVSSMPMKRRLPDGSERMSVMLLVAMNDALRGSSSMCVP